MFLIVVRAFDGTVNSKTVSSPEEARTAAKEAFNDARTSQVSITPIVA